MIRTLVAQKKKRFSQKKQGFSLIEVLIVVTILGILMIGLFLSMQKQLARSRDAKRKTDIEKIKVAFENYYNDNGCYPPADILSECRGAQLSPYIKEIPCDPQDGAVYTYVPAEGDQCSGYRLFAELENQSDPVIAELGCATACGCGLGSAKNYGVSAGVPLVSGNCPAAQPSLAPTSLPSAPPSTAPGIEYSYACSTTGRCDQFERTYALAQCPYRWTEPQPCIAFCNANLDNTSVRCNSGNVSGGGGGNTPAGGSGQ